MSGSVLERPWAVRCRWCEALRVRSALVGTDEGETERMLSCLLRFAARSNKILEKLW